MSGVRILNLGIVAHVDAGKTTTVEQILYRTGVLRAPGSVDKGTTQTDFLPVERARGISVASSAVILTLDDLRIHIIDTPGHMDFTGEVERALLALDGAVLVVSAAEGIQSQTERFWKALRAMQLPTILFLNKIDRQGCRPEAVLRALRADFGAGIVPISKIEPGDAVRVSLAPPDDEGLLELCEHDSGLAARYLNNEPLPAQTVEAALARLTAEGKVFPLVYGAAAEGAGIDDLTEAIRRYLPARAAAPDGDPSGIVYKVEHDKTLGKIAHVRMFEGTLCNRDAVRFFRLGLPEPFGSKITQIRKVSGTKREDIGRVSGNEIAALCGVTGVRAGDMVGRLLPRHSQNIAQPLFMVQLFGPPGQESRLLQAVSELSDEDPLMDYTWNLEERELVIRIMGKIQLEVLEFLLKERYGLEAGFSPPSVIYKETVARRGVGLEQYTMPKPCWAVVHLQADPLPRGSGFEYESVIKANTLQYRYQNHVETAVPEALKQGRLGWEVTDVKFTLIGGGDHHIHTHPLDFFLATPIAVMRALEDGQPTLLEPLVKLRLTADEGLSGKLIGDILNMRGTFDAPVITGGQVTIEAIVPVAESMEYAIQFAALTSGRGLITSDFWGYTECPPSLGRAAKRRGIDPLDRAKWILHKRGAYTQ